MVEMWKDNLEKFKTAASAPVDQPKQIEKFNKHSVVMEYCQSVKDTGLSKRDELAIREMVLKMNEIIDALNEIRNG